MVVGSTWNTAAIIRCSCFQRPAHLDDEQNPLLKNVEYLERECVVAAVGIRIAARYEPELLRRRDRMARAEIVQKFLDEIERRCGQRFDLRNNFSALLHIFSGQI